MSQLLVGVIAKTWHRMFLNLSFERIDFKWFIQNGFFKMIFLEKLKVMLNSE